MRPRLAALLALGALMLLAAVPAQAADVTVNVGDNFFSPDEVRIEPGDTVTWRWTGLDMHTVTSYDGQSESFESGLRGPGATFPHTFNTRGRFQYFCRPHPVEMDSVIQVGDPLPPGAAGDSTQPKLTEARVRHRSLCRRRTRTCRRRSTRIVFNLSEDARVRVRIASVRRPRRVLKSYSRSLRQGRRSVGLSSKRLRPGRYRASLVATDAAGNRSETERVRFRVRRLSRG